MQGRLLGGYARVAPPGSPRPLPQQLPTLSAAVQHPRGAALLEVGFDAVRAVVLAVRVGLVGDTDGETVYRLAYYAGGWG